MKKSRTEKQNSDRAALLPAAQRSASGLSSAEGQVQLKAELSRQAQNLATSINGSSALASQRKTVNNLSQSNPQNRISQPNTGHPLLKANQSVAQKLAADSDALPFAESDVDAGYTRKQEIGVSGADADSSVDGPATSLEERIKKAKLPTAEDSEGSHGKAEISPRMREIGLRLLAMEEPGEAPAKKDEKKPDEPGPVPDPVPAVAAGVPNHFIKEPTKYTKLKKADTSFEKYKQTQEQKEKDEKAAKDKKGKGDGSKTSAAEDSLVSEYTDGIIGLVKKGFNNCMSLKTAYEDYQLIKDNTDEDPSKMEAAKAAFDTALSGTSMVLSAINSYQKNFGAAQSLALKAAIPAVSIVMSTISLIGRIVTLVKNNKLDFGKTAEESQTDSILSLVQGDEKKKADVKAILQSDKFRSTVIAAAEFRQQERDNSAIFDMYRKSLDDPQRQETLRKRYPDNFARIEEISKKNNMKLDELGPETQQLISMGVTPDMLEAIIGDQTLINHLEEVKDKRSTNAKIGIFTDLVNIGGDIATLSGAGAIVGTAMKAGAAAVDAARAGGNAIKFAARAKGAENFAEGGEGGLWGASIYDNTDILKNDEAKQERYFHSSRRLVENIADHDKRVVDVGKTPNKEQVDSINQSYGWIETKILGTGASVSLVKAMANADSKSGNDLVGHLMEKMKTR